jgi:hypothetical protein
MPQLGDVPGSVGRSGFSLVAWHFGQPPINLNTSGQRRSLLDSSPRPVLAKTQARYRVNASVAGVVVVVVVVVVAGWSRAEPDRSGIRGVTASDAQSHNIHRSRSVVVKSRKSEAALLQRNPGSPYLRSCCVVLLIQHSRVRGNTTQANTGRGIGGWISGRHVARLTWCR